MKRTTTMGAAAGIALAAGLLAAPAANAAPTPAAPLLAEDAIGTCEVTGGTLDWGVKESFRSYISGTIANGGWEVADGATYETPLFGWSGATGSFDPSTGAGDVSFTGSITFTGHGGILNMVMANPTISFAEDGSVRILLDVRSNDTSGELATDVQQAELGTVSIPAPVEPVTGPVAYAEAPVTLSEPGVAAFGNFYQAGDALDPLNLAFDIECASPEPAPEVTTQAPETDVTEDDAVLDEAEPDFPWVPVVVGAVAIIVIAVAIGMLVAGRKKKSADDPDAADSEDPTP